jgi:hypothetical protein
MRLEAVETRRYDAAHPGLFRAGSIFTVLRMTRHPRLGL